MSPYKNPRHLIPCACGCGKIIEDRDKQNRQRKYKVGHNARGSNNYWFGKHPQSFLGRRHTDATKAKISYIRKGKHLSETTKSKMSASQKGEGNSFWGKHHTLETKNKITSANKGNTYRLGKLHTTETKLKVGLASKGRIFSEESKHKRSLALTGKPHSQEWINNMKKGWTDELRQRMSLIRKGKPFRAEHCAKIGLANRGRHHSTETIHKLSTLQKQRWANPEYAHKLLSQICHHPNRKESQLFTLINTATPDQYRFTGDGSFGINNLYPDFTNCVGRRKVIEHYGTYWHRGENTQDRIDKFAEVGFDCLIIWENELKDEKMVIQKLIEFNNQ